MEKLGLGVPFALWIVLFSLMGVPLTAGAAKRPNIVIMMADDLGIGDLGCFGNTTLRTPHLDKLASEGVKLTQHLAAASVCSPSRTAFLTGRYPIRSGMAPRGVVAVIAFLASTAGLPPSEITFAELAKEAGYSTALIGKWHLGLNCAKMNDSCHHPMSKGFDYYYGIPLTNFKDFGGEGDYVILSLRPHIKEQLMLGVLIISICTIFLYVRGILGKFATGFLIASTLAIVAIFLRYFLDLKVFGSVLMREYDVVEQPIRLKTLTQRFVLEGQEFLQKRHQDGNPFLLFMSWSHVHTYLDNMDQFVGKTQHGPYGDGVEELDWGAGQILQSIESLGFKDNTVVYFTSDNGGHLEEYDIHNRLTGGYNGIYRGGKTHGAAEGGIRVPGIMRWPGVIPAGTSTNEPTSLMDLFPTFARIVGRPEPADRIVDGKDLRPLVSGQKKVSPHQFLFHYFGSKVNAVRFRPKKGSDAYKLVLARPNYLPGVDRCSFACSARAVAFLDKPELFNIMKDPGEQHPLDYSNNAAYSKITDDIHAALKLHQNGIKPVQTQYTFFNMIWRPWLQPCCNFPYCSCEDQKYNIST